MSSENAHKDLTFRHAPIKQVVPSHSLQRRRHHLVFQMSSGLTCRAHEEGLRYGHSAS
jgi:hypothetical protein